MKRYKNLFEQICTYENFRKAYKNAIKGKSHYLEVKIIQRSPQRYLRRLLEDVKNKTYTVSDYIVFHKITGGKDREIYKLPMRDRIVQYAIMNFLEPIFRENFIVDTFSFIKGRGVHRGLNRLKTFIKQKGYTHCLKFDIHKCYPSLDKDILKAKLTRKFKDKDLLWLLFTIVDSCGNGVPIGNYTSQYFNNFYFSDFDHWLKEVKKVDVLRYCDDIAILGYDSKSLINLFVECKSYINYKLNIQIKSNYQVFPINDRSVDMFGYQVRQDYIKIRKATKKNFIDKVSKMDLNNLSERDINVLGSYWGILKHADCRNLWYKYTGVKTFKELNIEVHKRGFAKRYIDKEIIVKAASSPFMCKYGKKVRLTIDCPAFNETDVYVSTTAEMIVEAVEKLKPEDYPFTTTIKILNDTFYFFT